MAGHEAGCSSRLGAAVKNAWRHTFIPLHVLKAQLITDITLSLPFTEVLLERARKLGGIKCK